MKYNGKIDRIDVLDYAVQHGREAAANLLLLAGPDGYAGSYENYKDLEGLLNNGLGEEVRA